MDRNKKIFIIGFILSVLIIPVTFAELFFLMVGEPTGISDPKLLVFTLFTRSGMIAITVWYGLKIGIKTIWAWILGFSIVIPYMWLIIIVYLFTRKPPIAETVTTDS